MPDGQDKSDDLIAELAKLMASNAGSNAEPEAKPAPKLVTVPDAPAQAPTPVRIPGMDTPSPVAPQRAEPAQPAPPPVSPGVLRIPGMDQPVPSAPTPAQPSAASPSAAPPVSAPDAKPAASFDFGTVPAAATFKPEPMANWQDREIPKPVASRPVTPVAPPVAPVVASPAAPVAAPTVAPAADAQEDGHEPEAELPSRDEPSPSVPPAKPAASPPAASPEAPSPMVAAAKASPTGDSFDFDFGFAANPPGPVTPNAAKVADAPASSDDPIADLIAAELDAADATPEVVKPAQPAPRSFSMSGPTAGSRPASSGPVPFRAPPAPTPSAPPAQAAVGRSEDRFGVAPSFGSSGRSQVAARPQPAAERDPMEEIESLIGEAVRVELTSEKPEPVATPVVAAAPQPPVRSAPVVPPLTAGLPPRRATIPEPDEDDSSADEAILAAAAASGSDVGRLDAVSAEPGPYKRVRAKPERRSGGMRQYVGMAVAGTLLLAAGFGLYWVLGMGGGTDGDAPVLQADVTPVKEVPPPTPTSTETQQGAVVFNELDGGNAAVPADEQLVSRDDSTETSVADVARMVGDGDDTSDSELANRKVRTVTVRPDGTIVSGDEAVAGNEELPVDRPNVPDLPGADVQPSELLAAIPTDTAAAATSTVAPEATDPTSLAALVPTETAPAAAIDPNVVAPVPVARPADRTALAGGANQQVATTQPTELVQQPVAAAPVSGGAGPYVQLSSQPSQPDAESSLRATQNRLSNLLAGRSLAIRPVDLGARGTWYRVVLPVDSFQEATQTCASLKANGVDCVPIGG